MNRDTWVPDLCFVGVYVSLCETLNKERIVPAGNKDSWEVSQNILRHYYSY